MEKIYFGYILKCKAKIINNILNSYNVTATLSKVFRRKHFY